MSYVELTGGKVSIRDFFEILRILDWKQYAQSRANALGKAEQG